MCYQWPVMLWSPLETVLDLSGQNVVLGSHIIGLGADATTTNPGGRGVAGGVGAWGCWGGWADVSCRIHSLVKRGLRYLVSCFPPFPCLGRDTDVGMVKGPGYEVERRRMWCAVSILFLRECLGWVLEALCWHHNVCRCAACVQFPSNSIFFVGFHFFLSLV